MPRAKEPHTPDIDLAARKAYVAAGGVPAVLTPELEAFCQSGLSVIVAAGLAGEAPVAGLGCGCRVLPDGRMRVLIEERANAAVIEIIRRGGSLAVTFGEPITHRSIQVKGSRVTIAVADDEDRVAAYAQSDGLRRQLLEIAYPPAFAAAYCQVEDGDDVIALDMTLDTAFVQTPGPGAGAELKP